MFKNYKHPFINIECFIEIILQNNNTKFNKFSYLIAINKKTKVYPKIKRKQILLKSKSTMIPSYTKNSDILDKKTLKKYGELKYEEEICTKTVDTDFILS